MQNFGRIAHGGMVFQRGSNARFITNQQKSEIVMAPTSKGSTLDHDPDAFITAHRVNCDTRQTHRQISGCGLLKTDCHNLAAVVIAAMLTQIVRALQLATIVAFVESFHFQRIMCAAISAAVRRYFSFRDSHFGTCSLI
jgi:hypothetical protein